MAGTQRLKLKDTDGLLVRRFARQHDAEAFSVLMGRYADMVYSTSWRILRDETLAADAVQETFFQLVKDADRITGSLGSWLHRVATCRAVDLIRQNVSRRNREKSYALEASSPANTWSEVEPAVDEALEQLPENLREILVLHFLQGRTTIQIAADQGISQPTISRRVAEALELLRQKLRDRGISAGAVPLHAVLLHTNQVIPEALRSSLGKIALAKAAGANSFWIVAGSAPVKIAFAACAIVLAASVVWLNRPANNKAHVVSLSPAKATQLGTNVVEKAQSQSEPLPLQAVAVGQFGQAQTSVPTPSSRATPAPVARRLPAVPSKTPPPPVELPPESESSGAFASPTFTVANLIGDDANSIQGGLPEHSVVAGNLPSREIILKPGLFKSIPVQLDTGLNKTNVNGDDQTIRNAPPIPTPAQSFAPARNPTQRLLPGLPANSRRTGN